MRVLTVSPFLLPLFSPFLLYLFLGIHLLHFGFTLFHTDSLCLESEYGICHGAEYAMTVSSLIFISQSFRVL